MQESTFAVLSVAASRSRNAVLECLNAGYTHPSEIAVKLKVTRQAVDKAVRELYDLGILDRSAVFPPEGRPRIIYTINRAGRNLLRALEDAGAGFYKDIDERWRGEQRELDDELAAGRVAEEVHARKSAELQKRWGKGRK